MSRKLHLFYGSGNTGIALTPSEISKAGCPLPSLTGKAA
jgi:hypothetical protein